MDLDWCHRDKFLHKSLTFCLFVLCLERVPGSYDWKGHLCPSGSRVHWALAEKCVGLSSSPAAWYPVCTSVFIPSACRSAALLWFTFKQLLISIQFCVVAVIVVYITYWCMIHNSAYCLSVSKHSYTIHGFPVSKCCNHRQDTKKISPSMNCLRCLRGAGEREPERNTEGSKRGKGVTTERGWGRRQETMRKARGKGAFVAQNVVITLLLAGNCSAWSWARSLGNWEAGNELQIKERSASPFSLHLSLRPLEII